MLRGWWLVQVLALACVLGRPTDERVGLLCCFAMQLLHGAIHEMCGTDGRYAPGAKSLVVKYQAMFQEATAKGLAPEEVCRPQPLCPSWLPPLHRWAESRSRDGRKACSLKEVLVRCCRSS